MNLEELAKATGYTVDELSELTEQERADLMEGEEFDEDTTQELDPNTGEPIEAEATAQEDDNDDEQGGDDGDETEQADNTAKAESQPAAHVTAPAPTATLPEDFDEQVSAIESEKKALYEQFDEGDITTAEYAQKLDELGKRERALERLKDRVEIEEQQRLQNWNNAVGAFLDQHSEYRNDERLFLLLDAEVRKLQAASENETDPRILAQAHEAIAQFMPHVFAGEQQKKSAPKAAPRTAPNLAGVPASDIDEPGASEFDYLDRLYESDPLRYEAELNKLQATNPAKFDQYMAS